MEAFGPWASEPWASLPDDLSGAEVAVKPARLDGGEPVAVVLLLEIDVIGLEAA